MTTYIALLRGIGPMNPNMRPQKLKEGFEKMGFKNVRTVISSGNVVFSSTSKSTAALEKKIETGLPKVLGFKSTTIVRSEAEINTLLKKNPEKGIVHGPKSYVLVTFLKEHSSKLRSFPKKGEGFRVIGVYEKVIVTATDTTSKKTPDIMLLLEKQLSKAITSRTWKTVERIAAKMAEKTPS